MDKFYKIKTACDRFEFFQKTITLFFLQLVFALTFWALTTYTGVKNILWLTPIFLIFIELPLLYFYFVLTVRRLRSILGVSKLSVLLALILLLLSFIGFIYAPILVVLIYVMLLLLPERDFNE